jgi:hypothetical protein
VRQSFFVLLPDPNVHGGGAVDASGSEEERDAAAAVYERGLTALTGLHSLRWDERIADGDGHLAVAEYALTDGTNGSPAAFSAASARSALVRVGSSEWIKRSDGAWTERPTAATFVPADFRETYEGATDFRLGRVEEIDGESCRIVTFYVPEDRYSEAWYAWWVGEESGLLRREAMVARGHYMLHHFHDFDASFTIAPPTTGPATPDAAGAATPPPTAVTAGRRAVRRSRRRQHRRG